MTFGTNVMVANATTGNVGFRTNTPSYVVEVNGSFAAVSKSFLIEHPSKDGMKLRYGSLEGPEYGVYIRGRSKENIITLPDYWKALIDENTITVELTPVNSFQPLYVISATPEEIHVGSDYGTMDYYFVVYAERKDIDKIVVEY
jgi:hypothetical protein